MTPSQPCSFVVSHLSQGDEIDNPRVSVSNICWFVPYLMRWVAIDKLRLLLMNDVHLLNSSIPLVQSSVMRMVEVAMSIHARWLSMVPHVIASIQDMNSVIVIESRDTGDEAK